MYNCIYIYTHTSNAEFSTVKYSIVLHEKNILWGNLQSVISKYKLKK